MAAVKTMRTCGFNMQIEDLRCDRDIVLAAVSQDGDALEYVDGRTPW